MDRYNTDKKFRKAVDDALTKGPSQKSLAMQKDLRKNPNLSVNELVKRTQENIEFDKKHPPLISTKAMLDNGLIDPEAVMVKYDSTTGIFSNKDKTIGFKDAVTARKHNEVYEPYSPTVQKLKRAATPYPTQANPQQMDYLKKNLDKMKYQNKPRGLNTVVYDGSKQTHKPTYRRGDAKIIVDELKKDKRKNNPLLRQKPFKLNFDMPVSLIKETPEEKLQRENFEKILEDSNKEKQRAQSSGLAYLLGSPKITERSERIENNVQPIQEEDYDL